MLEPPSRSATREAPPAAAPTDAPSPTPTAARPPPAAAPSPSPTAKAAEPEWQPENAPAAQQNQQQRGDDEPGNRHREPVGLVPRGRGCARKRDPALLRARLRDQVHAEGEPRAVLLAGEVRRQRVPDAAHASVGQEAFGAAAGSDEEPPRTGAVILQRHEQHDDAEILRRVAGFTLRPHAPRAPDLQ